MSTKTTGITIAVVGLLIGLLFALADVIGVGTDPGAFGWAQIVGLIVGVVMLAAGIFFFVRSGGSTAE